MAGHLVWAGAVRAASVPRVIGTVEIREALQILVCICVGVSIQLIRWVVVIGDWPATWLIAAFITCFNLSHAFVMCGLAGLVWGSPSLQ